MSEETILRLGIIVAGVVLMALIFWFGRPSAKTQGVRRERSGRQSLPKDDTSDTAGTGGDANAADADRDAQIPVSTADTDSEAGGAAADVEVGSEIGRRRTERMDKVVKLYVAARAGHQFEGSDVVVAAEKIGTVFGHGNAFHRLVERKPSLDPIYTVANVQNKGSLDINTISTLQTPAIAFYLMLPAPTPALEAFDMMLPAAKRAAELLNGVLLDEQQNVVSRQTIAHIREELRQYDREHEISETNAHTGKASRWS